MKLIDKDKLNEYNNNNEYVWYACYGSNINYKRYMMYINGGEHASKEGCEDKTEPLEYRKYIFNNPIYFAGESRNWTGGMAFLDCESNGKSYGKIYKIKMRQFRRIFEQENELYDAIILLDYIEDIPVLTFTSKNKLNNLLNEPSCKYIEIIKDGLKDLDYGLTENEMNEYFKNSKE